MKYFTKKIRLLIVLILSAYQANSQTYLVTVGSEIYEVDPQNCTETMLCDIIVNTGGGTISFDYCRYRLSSKWKFIRYSCKLFHFY